MDSFSNSLISVISKKIPNKLFPQNIMIIPSVIYFSQICPGYIPIIYRILSK